MKRIASLILVAVLMLALVSPVLAINEQPKFSRENYIYAKAAWTYGDPHEEEPFQTIDFEIGRNKVYQEQFQLYLEIWTSDGETYLRQSFWAMIPESEFVFPKKLDSGMDLTLQVQGTQYWHSFKMDENGEQTDSLSGEEPADYAFDLTWTQDNHAYAFVNNHFALNWGESSADLIDLVYKSKEEHVSGLVSGTINDLELAEGQGEYGIKIDKTPFLYSESEAAAMAEASGSAKQEEVVRYNEKMDISNIMGNWFIPFEDDPDNGSSLTLSIGMYDKEAKSYTLNVYEDILNEDREIIGNRIFVAAIPGDSFAFPKQSPGTINLEVHVCGNQYDYLFDEMEPVITENIEHDIKAAWQLSTTYSSRAISKYADDFSKSMDIQRTADYEGTVSMILDGKTFDEGGAWGGLWTEHWISRSTQP